MKKIPIRQISAAQQEPASSGRFNLRKVEDLLGENGLVHGLHRHDFFFILVLQHGRGRHAIDFTAYQVLDNTVFFLRPGQVHQLELEAGSTGFLMEFNTEFYCPKGGLPAQRLRRASNRNHCLLEARRFEKLHATVSHIFQEYTSREEGYVDAIKAHLAIFFIQLLRQGPDPKGPPTNANPYAQERLEEFLALLDTHIATHKQVVQYTDLMNLSPYQLNEITKDTVGRTPSALINAHIVLEAKRQLLATAHQIKEIADLLGYEDASYFIRFFKKHTGHSPEAFRHKLG